MIEDGRSRKVSRTNSVVNWLFAGLFLLAAPFCVAALIELGGWPMIPVAVLWIPLGHPLFFALPTYVEAAARYLILGRSPTPSRVRTAGFHVYASARHRLDHGVCICDCPRAGRFDGIHLRLAPWRSRGNPHFRTGPICGWFFGRASRKREAVRAAEEEQLRAQKCPQCNSTYGGDAVVVFYGSRARVRIPSDADLRHVIVQCAKCRYMQVFSAAGEVLMAFQPDEELLKDLP